MSTRETKTINRMSLQFGNYVLRHPSLLDRIPKKASIVVTVRSNPNIWKKKMDLAKTVAKRDKKACYLAMRTRTGWRFEKVAE